MTKCEDPCCEWRISYFRPLKNYERLRRKKYGKVPLKQVDHYTPWTWVDIDCIDPYTVKTPNKTWQLSALTMIDPTTGWFEVKDLSTIDSHNCMRAFDDTWLTHYP